tara:strand:+ start:662 stop:1906 length:1245 start_codon:yes stop_codon:yes gene_type:complete
MGVETIYKPFFILFLSISGYISLIKYNNTKKMKSIIKFLSLVLIIFYSFSQNVFSEEKIKIGLIVPLSGEYSDIGHSIVNSVRLAINKIDDNKIEIFPRDTRANPSFALKVSEELREKGIKIIIGPLFNNNIVDLKKLNDITFISLTNKIYKNPKNIISAGVNAISQINTIKKFQNKNNIERSVLLIPNNSDKNEIKYAINETKIILKDIFEYDTDPTLLTSQIENLTRYPQRKQNLLDEIKRLEESSEVNKEKKIENLKKKDTLGGINFDSVIIADFDESLKSVATSLLYTDISSKRIKYITLNQWFEKSLLKEKNLQPIYFPSINKDNYENFIQEYYSNYNSYPNQISFLSYDLVGLIYYLLYKNDFIVDEKIFLKKNKFKGKIGIFEINQNKITHQLNFYSIEDGEFKKIF